MDKYEYKIRSEEIKTLIGRKKYAEAMEIADTIDWRKVKNVNMLCTVSDLYKLSRRYEESREILLLAYERYPGGRMIIYSLCELCIKLDDVVHAVEYYKEFVQTAPRDNGRYVLQYKLYEAQEVTLEERIAVLEELKRREYREKWAYELAYLYHRIGLGTKCVEECDELILWFGEGKYVTKAMELKMLHAPLSPEQQKKYNKGKGGAVSAPAAPELAAEPVAEEDDLDIQVKPLNVGEYATINLQRELAESMRQVLGEEESQQNAQPTIEYAAVRDSYTMNYTTDEIRDFQTELENNDLEIYEEDYQTDEFEEEEVRELQEQQEVYLPEEEYEEYEDYSGIETQPQMFYGDMQQAYAGMPQQEAYEQTYAEAPQSQPYGRELQPQVQSYGRAPQAQTYAGMPQMQAYGGVSQPQMYAETPQMQAYGGASQSQVYTGTPQIQIYKEQPQARVSAARPQPQTHRKVQSQATYHKPQPEISMEGPGEFTREILSNLLQDIEEPEKEETVHSDKKQYDPVPAEEEVFFEDPDTMELSLPPLEEAEPARVVRMSRTAEIPKIVQSSGEEILSPVTYYGKKQDQTQAPDQEETKEKEIAEIPAETEEEEVAVEASEEADNSDVQTASAEDMTQEKNRYDTLLTQEYDGQIRLAVTAEDEVEKQITGQMSIGDILEEWEKRKKEHEQKRAEAVRKRVKEQTGEIFSQFDASTKEGILAELDALAEETEKREKRRFSEEKEKDSDAVKEEEALPEVEELEEIEEMSLKEQFSQETREAVNEAVSAQMSPEEDNAAAKNAGNDEGNTETEEEPESVTESEEPAEEESHAEEPHEEEPAAPVKAEKQQRPEKKPAEKSEKIQRPMTAEEKKLFGPFIQTRSTKDQILDTLDHISLASYTGNVILTGDAGMGSIKLAKNIIKDIQMTDSNFSGRMAKITGQALNNKDMEKTFSKLSNGALIVEGAGELKEGTIKSMVKLLEQEGRGIIIILEDTRINMNRLLDNYKILHQNFNLRIDIEALDNDSLVLFAKKYALEREYAIDELGVLALYTRIAELQTSEHSVTTKEVKEIVEEAIHHADRKNMSHFMDVLLGKRYDDEDMIILREKDFVL